jgi:acetyl esterase
MLHKVDGIGVSYYVFDVLAIEGVFNHHATFRGRTTNGECAETCASRSMSIVGRSYLERGAPVVVLIQWGPGGGPRNVLIERRDGRKVVRPFRGLRLSR